MSKKHKKRFFMKRVEEEVEQLAETPATVVQSVKDLLETEVFPQNSRSITAPILSRILVFFSYFGVTFVSGIILWSFVSPAIPRMEPLVARLTYEPLSTAVHLDYLDFLVKSHRIDDATNEARFIVNLHPVFPLNEKNYARFQAINSEIMQKQSEFTLVVNSYLYWQTTLQERPQYRDGLYMHALYSYMLFDEGSAKENLSRAVSLDPQFEIGATVLSKLDKQRRPL